MPRLGGDAVTPRGATGSRHGWEGEDPGPTLPCLPPLSGVSHRLDLTVAPALLLAFTGAPVTHSTRSEVLGPLWALPRLTPA